MLLRLGWRICAPRLEVTDVTAPVGLNLARVTVATPKRRIDVALPDNAIVAELLPHLLHHAGEELADEGESHGGWTLRRSTGALIEPTRSLTAQGVRDGEVLQMVPRRVDWPELAYDDVVDIIAGGARRTGRSWGRPATRWCGIAVAATTLGVAAALVALSGPPWAPAAGVALAVALALTGAGVLLSRSYGDAVVGAAVATCALPFAALTGLVAAPADSGLSGAGAPSLLLGSGSLLLFSVIGFTGVAAGQRLFMAGIGVGAAGLTAASLCLAGMSTAGSAAVVLTVALGLLPSYPLIASWLGRIPVPTLPDRAEAILEDRPVPDRSDVFAAVARATELLSGMLLAASVVSVVASAILIGSGTPAAELLAGSGALALLLRGRLFPAAVQRIPLLASGFVGLAMFVVAARAHLTNPLARLAVLAIVLATAALVLAAGLAYSRRSPTPYVGRIADILDVLAIMVLVPFACAVVGVYEAVRAVFAGFG